MYDYLHQMFELASQRDTQGIWFWISVYLALVCTYSLYFQLRTRFWPSTTGQLMQLGIDEFGGAERRLSDQEYIGRALYTFEVDGQLYEGRRISPWVFVASHNLRALLKWQLRGVQVLEDDRVRVFYNPGNPEKSFLIIANWVGIVFTALVAYLPGVIHFANYHR